MPEWVTLVILKLYIGPVRGTINFKMYYMTVLDVLYLKLRKMYYRYLFLTCTIKVHKKIAILPQVWLVCSRDSLNKLLNVLYKGPSGWSAPIFRINPIRGGLSGQISYIFVKMYSWNDLSYNIRWKFRL